jgi:hypothetical protein
MLFETIDQADEWHAEGTVYRFGIGRRIVDLNLDGNVGIGYGNQPASSASCPARPTSW